MFREHVDVSWKSDSWMNPVGKRSGSVLISDDALFLEHGCRDSIDGRVEEQGIHEASIVCEMRCDVM